MDKMNLKEIASFIASSRANRWFERDKRISLYLRRTRRYIDGSQVESVDIATVEVREEYQGKGIFTEYLTAIEDLAKEYKLTVYIENIHNVRLGEFILKRGYVKVPNIRDFCTYKKF